MKHAKHNPSIGIQSIHMSKKIQGMLYNKNSPHSFYIASLLEMWRTLSDWVQLSGAKEVIPNNTGTTVTTR